VSAAAPAPVVAAAAPVPVVEPRPAPVATAAPPARRSEPASAPRATVFVEHVGAAEQVAAPAAAPVAVAKISEPAEVADAPAAIPRGARDGWVIQVGALESVSQAKERLGSARSSAANILTRADPFTEKVVKGDKTLYRARFAGLDKDQAEAACRTLKRSDIPCMLVAGAVNR
jgi:D-alanyl-D-alanine carboxypeptidase